MTVHTTCQQASFSIVWNLQQSYSSHSLTSSSYLKHLKCIVNNKALTVQSKACNWLITSWLLIPPKSLLLFFLLEFIYDFRKEGREHGRFQDSRRRVPNGSQQCGSQAVWRSRETYRTSVIRASTITVSISHTGCSELYGNLVSNMDL